MADTQPASTRFPAARRSLRHGHLRRFRRSHQAQADPALYNLAKDNVLSKEFAIIGFARNESTTEEFRAKLTAEINEFATSKVDPELWNWFVERIYYISGEFGDPAAYKKLAEQLDQVKKNHGTHGQLLFLSRHCAGVFRACRPTIGRRRIGERGRSVWRRVIIEKPFGRDYDIRPQTQSRYPQRA